MATYEYKCSGCNHAFETTQSMLDDTITRCPMCNKDTLTRVIHPTPSIFKGHGWTRRTHKRRT